MKNERVKLTDNEKIAFINANGKDYTIHNMAEKSIDSLVEKEKARKFNNELEQFQDNMDKRNNEVKEAQDKLGYDINKAEIKPLFKRLLIKPFKQNPFQQMKVEKGIITDAGGYTPHTQVNPLTGKYEEQDQFIRTGCVVEVGPETKYLKEGDVIYYRKDTAVPVPFIDWGLISLDENQVIAVVNIGLDKRFKDIK